MDNLCICRCCLSDGCYKDIGNEYFFSGQKEVYADLLLSTFDVKISHKEGTGPSSSSRLICESCIQRLREAAAFKQQILDAESNIEILLRKLRECENETVTSKLARIDTYNHHADNNFSDHSDNDQEFENTIDANSEINENDMVFDEFDLDLDDEVDDDAFDGFDEEGQLFLVHLIKKEEELKTMKKSKSNKKVKQCSSKIKSKENNEQDNIKKRQRNTLLPGRARIVRMKENTIQLVVNSNLCLFKSRRVKYQCYYCTESCLSTDELRKHCDREHIDENMVRKALKNISTYKNAEITNLTCKRCQRPCDDLDDLQGHLVDQHMVTFNPEGHLLMAYKISEFEMNCLLCGLEFLSFSRLGTHMHAHYPHNVCEVCGAGYKSKDSLRLHKKIHKEKKCSMCDCKFTVANQRMKHMAVVHGIKQLSTYKCNLCSDQFKYFYKLREHKLAAHGAGGRRQYPCTDCGKIFKHPTNLRIHNRSVHLRERRYQCSSCDKSFFTKTDQTRHERSHGQATIPCVHCTTRFKTKDSWRRHQRRQHSDTLKR